MPSFVYVPSSFAHGIAIQLAYFRAIFYQNIIRHTEIFGRIAGGAETF